MNTSINTQNNKIFIIQSFEYNEKNTILGK